MTPLKTTVTFLQMWARPPLPPRVLPGVPVSIMQARRCTVPFYRYLYESVGKPWVWVNRRRASDAELARILADEGIAVHVLYADGEPAGYAEFDARNRLNIELSYFGLAPAFVGMGLGAFFLREAVSIAWDMEPKRLHVQTCTLDHPRALPLYQRMGFVPFSRTVAHVEPIGDEPHPLVEAQRRAATG